MDTTLELAASVEAKMLACVGQSVFHEAPDPARPWTRFSSTCTTAMNGRRSLDVD